ncbi:hypothetical protein ABPG74_021605 [Tetrahymena malaccensis]
MKVKYSLLEVQFGDKISEKAVIESVEECYGVIKPLIGFFSHTPYRPKIDFDLQSKKLEQPNLKKIYFFPLQNNYPTMILEINEPLKECLNGDIFKHYYVVKVVDWPERLSREGPLVEIQEQRGKLYDQESDCQALLESLNMNSTISKQELVQVNKIVEDHKKLFSQNKNSKEYENLNVFTIDQQGAQAFDDAFSLQKINSKMLEKEIELAKKPKKSQKEQNEPAQNNGKKKKDKKAKKGKKEIEYEIKKKDDLENQNEEEAKQEQQESISGGMMEEQKELDQTIKQQQLQQQNDQQEEQKQVESVIEDTECTRKIFKLGIHIADLSQSIKKGSELYKALEKRGQSIYVPLGKNKSFVKHMLDRKLVQLFSLKAGEQKRAKSLFICLEQDQNQQFAFIWDSLRFEDTVIESKQNYYYEEFDSFLKENKQNITELFKDDDEEEEEEDVSSDDDEDEDDKYQGVHNQNKKLILTSEEFLTFFKIGGQLFQQRIIKGQKAFQEEFTEKDRYVSSKLVEELMIFYNQSISRQIQLSQQIFKGQKDIDKKVEELKQEAKKMKKSIESNKTQIQGKIQKQQKVLDASKKTSTTLNKNINGTKKQIDNNPQLLKEYEKKIQANAKKIEDIKNQIEKISAMEDSQFEQEFNKTKKQGVQKKAEAKKQDNDQDVEREQLSDSKPNQLSQLTQDMFKILVSPSNLLQQPRIKLSGTNQSENSDNSDESDEESQTKSINSQPNDKEDLKDSENIYTSQKKRLNKQLQNLNQQFEQLEKDLNSLVVQKSSNKFERVKESIKDTLNHYKKKCELAGFKEMKFDSLQEFQKSIDTLKNAKIIPIIKKYLIFEKRKIVKQLNEYFSICDDEKRQEQQLNQKKKSKEDQKQKILKDIQAIKEKIAQAEKKEEQQKAKDLELQNQEQIEVEEERFTEDEESETHSQISMQDIDIQAQDSHIKISLKQKKINLLQQQIKQKENENLKMQNLINNNESIIEQNRQKLEKFSKQSEQLKEQVKTQEDQINELKKQLAELNLEIQKLDQNLKEEKQNLQKQLEKDVNENFKHFDLTPQSEKYLSLTSPIRKFNDIQAQQFIDDYLEEGFSQEFDEEYTKIIKSKQNITKTRNHIAKFLEKAEKIKKCRKMIRQAQQRQNIDQNEEILQINSKLISKYVIYDFFLPKQMQLVQLKNNKMNLQLQETFSIWKGQIQAKLSLPYDYTVEKAQKENITLQNQND